VGVACLDRDIDFTDGPACARVARELELDVDGEGRLLSRGQVVDMDGLLGEEPGAAASRVGQLPEVRQVLVAAQQRIGAHWDLVTEGRDTTTVVFPKAEYKFYLTASLEERARRRHGQMGQTQCEESLKDEIVLRDRMDQERAASPLSLAEDACIVNTDGMSIAQVVEALYGRVQAAAAALDPSQEHAGE
ncbi:MAG: (d)CMP kinase, partial [Planctomycetes bacterium]|nr:(d)CMP kinase [Planctomycetota bacterium]